MTIVPHFLRSLAVAALLAAVFPAASTAADVAPCAHATSAAGAPVPVRLRAEAPLLGRIVEEFAARDLGEAISDEGLTDRTREIALMAASAAVGDFGSTQRHAKAALAAGATQAELKELLYLTAAHSGVDKAIAATHAVSELLGEREEHGS